LRTIKSRVFGDIEVSEQQNLKFPDGILGFEFIKEYYLLDIGDSPFYSLQAAGEADIAFILIQPETFMKDYRLLVSNADLEVLGIENKEDLLDFAIVTVPDNPAQMTANLQGPIIVNRKTRIARQIISLNEEYCTKHPILSALQEKNQGGT
jgi:flagellar assembly factor FliW